MKLIKSLVLSSLFLAVIFIVGCNEAPVTSNEIAGTNQQLSKVANSATLYLWNYNANGQTVNIYGINQDWMECTATWNNQPTIHPGLEGSFVTNVAEGWVTADITGLVNKWLDGTYDNYGLMLTTAGTLLEVFDSKEGTNKPYIHIVYSDGSEDVLDIADTEINQLYPDENNCTDEILFLGIINGYEKKSLLKFDVEYVPEETCETAYAFGGSIATCFLDLTPISANNWGWTNLISPENTYQWPVYAGAGQCDITKGTLVGHVDVSYIGGTITVDYVLDPGFTLGETHVWIGNNPLPQKNGIYQTAPGKFNYNGLDPVVLTGQTGNKYVAVHAGVCWFEE